MRKDVSHILLVQVRNHGKQETELVGVIFPRKWRMNKHCAMAHTTAISASKRTMLFPIKILHSLARFFVLAELRLFLRGVELGLRVPGYRFLVILGGLDDYALERVHCIPP